MYPCYNIVYVGYIIIDSLDGPSMIGVRAEFTVTADSVQISACRMCRVVRHIAMCEFKEHRSSIHRARDWVAKDLDLEHGGRLSLFETIIRIIGGLVAAFDASGDKMFLQKAEELAEKLQVNFPQDKKGVHSLAVYSSNVPLRDQGCADESRSWFSGARLWSFNWPSQAASKLRLLESARIAQLNT